MVLIQTLTALLKKSNRTIFPDDQPTSLRVGTADIPFTTCARSIGFMTSHNMTWQANFNCLPFCLRENRPISSTRQYLTAEASKTVVCVFVLFKLDCCNYLLSGCPIYLHSRLQKVENSAAKLVYKARKRIYVQPLLQILHWLPVQARTDDRLSYLSQRILWLISCLLWPFSLCTPLPGSLVLLQTHGYFVSPTFE